MTGSYKYQFKYWTVSWWCTIGAVIASQGGTALGYQSAYSLIGCVAIIIALLALGLKNQAEQLATMKSNN